MISKAIILVSGGLDSTTCLALAKDQGYECYALTFDYGQQHRAELSAAKTVANSMGVTEHRIIHLPIGEFGGSALTDTHIEVPDFQHSEKIPVTYVPARNTIFLSIALGWAEVLAADHIFIGVSAIDYSNYPDCRPEYIQAFQKMADIATKKALESTAIQIHTPLIQLNKAETIALGMDLGVDYGMTVTCYKPTAEGKACGSCDSCALRIKGFNKAGVEDPTSYLTVA